VHQERVVDVLLNDVSSVLLGGAVHNSFDLVHGFTDLDSVATIRVLARLDDPRVLGHTILALDLSQS